MSARKTNVVKTNEATWTYAATARDNTLTAQISYKDDFIGWGSRCPSLRSVHPDLTGFLLTKINASREEGGQIKVVLDYEASSGDVEYPGKDPAAAEVALYSVQVASREEHILTNLFCEGLSEEERKALYAISNGSEADSEGTLYETVVTSETGQAVLAKILKGNISYKTGGLVYIERKTVDSLDEIEWGQVGRYEKPPGPAGAAAKNWLYIGATADPSDTGESWTLERQWEYSPDGWDEDLYAP